MTPADVARDADEMFLRAEQGGLRLAIIGRIAALALMGVWLIGTRADDPTRALGYVLVLSLFAALGLVHSSREFAGERIRVRIGINTGSLVAGNVGGGGRQSYTVHGDAVNLAARLEALCKDHGKSLLLSATTAKALPEAKLIAVGDITVRGLAQPVTVFSIPSEGGVVTG